MFVAPFGFGMSCFLCVTFGETFWLGGVIKIEEYKSDGLWHVVVYCGGPDNREINPAVIRHVLVEGKAKDPLTGRLLIDEMRELLKTKELALIRFYWKDGVCRAVAMQKFLDGKMRLNLEHALP